MSDTPSRTISRAYATPTLVVIVVCLIYVLGVLISAGGDPLAFAVLGTRFSKGDPQGTEGYDGHFPFFGWGEAWSSL